MLLMCWVLAGCKIRFHLALARRRLLRSQPTVEEQLHALPLTAPEHEPAQVLQDCLQPLRVAMKVFSGPNPAVMQLLESGDDRGITRKWTLPELH